jgi:hypothetical protein
MRIRITNCPKREKALPVFRTINPVTQVAEVAVKRALMKLTLLPSLEAIGKVRSKAPVIITKSHPNAIIRSGDNLDSLIAGAVIIVEIVSHLFLVNF